LLVLSTLTIAPSVRTLVIALTIHIAGLHLVVKKVTNMAPQDTALPVKTKREMSWFVQDVNTKNTVNSSNTISFLLLEHIEHVLMSS